MISGLEIDYEPPGLTVSSEEPDMRAVDVNDTLTLSQSELIRHSTPSHYPSPRVQPLSNLLLRNGQSSVFLTNYIKLPLVLTLAIAMRTAVPIDLYCYADID